LRITRMSSPKSWRLWSLFVPEISLWSSKMYVYSTWYSDEIVSTNARKRLGSNASKQVPRKFAREHVGGTFSEGKYRLRRLPAARCKDAPLSHTSEQGCYWRVEEWETFEESVSNVVSTGAGSCQAFFRNIRISRGRIGALEYCVWNCSYRSRFIQSSFASSSCGGLP